MTKGYMIQTAETETLFAVLPDGRVLTSGPIARPNIHMHKSGRRWVLCDAVPEAAEFIGDYAQPTAADIQRTA